MKIKKFCISRQEHPNYKYRPRRKPKHSGGGGTGHQSQNPTNSNQIGQNNAKIVFHHNHHQNCPSAASNANFGLQFNGKFSPPSPPIHQNHNNNLSLGHNGGLLKFGANQGGEIFSLAINWTTFGLSFFRKILMKFLYPSLPVLLSNHFPNKTELYYAKINYVPKVA